MSGGEPEVLVIFRDRRDAVVWHVSCMLSDMGMDAASIRTWLYEPNRYLYGRMPVSEIGAGNFLDVLNAVRAIREGSFGINPSDERDKK